jgi:reverse gyrase
MNYQEFLETKKKSFISSGFEIKESLLNKNLFDFQRHIVKIALKKGRFAIFADCGLGKTLMQLSWAESVFNHTGKKVLILAPLAVVEQTNKEAAKFGIEIKSYDITNYEQLPNTKIDDYIGVVLDESSISKELHRQIQEINN